MLNYFENRPNLNHKYNYWLKDVEKRGILL